MVTLYSEYFMLYEEDTVYYCQYGALSYINPLSLHDAFKRHFTSLKTDLIFLQPKVLERKFSWNWFTNTLQFSWIFRLLHVILIYYKARIATAIRGL